MNCRALTLFLGFVGLLFSGKIQAARVTIITHGYNASVDEWIVPMAHRIANYASFWGTNASCYQVTVSRNNSSAFVVSSEFLDGTAAHESDSGNILIKLDWSDVAGSLSPFEPAPFNVTQIAEVVAPALQDENLIQDLQGHAIAEYSMHLIGHSRGGPLVTEIARLLGANGIWVDQITTLDPHPCDPTDFLESIGCPVDDAAPLLYENLYFADNYWQNTSTPTGQNVSGAYNRQLSSLPFGYGSPHSNVHLWYHGTIDFTSPNTSDTGATLTDTDRLLWFASGETNGTWAGYLSSFVGGGDRNSTTRPNGSGTAEIREGLTGPRLPLPVNNGAWPNVVSIDAVNSGWFEFQNESGLATREENVVYSGDDLFVELNYQSGENVALELFLDNDANALNGNEIELVEESWNATGVSSVSNTVLSVTINSQDVANGLYFLGARITASSSGATRTTYGPQKIAVLEPLSLSLQSTSPTESQLTVTGSAGYQAVIESTEAFLNWNSVATNTFMGETKGEANSIPNVVPVITETDFYRATYLRISEGE